MPLLGIWKWYHLLLVAILVAGFAMWLGGAIRQTEREAYKPGPARPATIDNVMLRIERNVMRIQSAMVEVVFSEYPKEMADDIKAIDSMDAAARRDFAAMGARFAVDNAQFAEASALFDQWKAIRDEAISLSADGPSLRARKIVQEQSEAQVWKIRSAMDVLSRFAQKRADDFDDAEDERHRQGTR